MGFEHIKEISKYYVYVWLHKLLTMTRRTQAAPLIFHCGQGVELDKQKPAAVDGDAGTWRIVNLIEPLSKM